MLTESIAFAVEKTAETVIKASEVADLGTIKPDGFGSLVWRQPFTETVKPQMDGLHMSWLPELNTRINLFNTKDTVENPYLSLRYNEISKECSEYLCDYGITPGVWQKATLEQRMDMMKTAAKIMANELNLPGEWKNAVEPIAVSGEGYMAAASCRIKLLDNGGGWRSDAEY